MKELPLIAFLLIVVLCLALWPITLIFWIYKYRTNRMHNSWFILSWYYNETKETSVKYGAVDYNFWKMLESHPEVSGLVILAVDEKDKIDSVIEKMSSP